ncbi:NDK domain containing protein [Asbolus verrucosus]|uniref:NDK domain containing protein n=1 Tax=Asbolus verrucosus TaxID=1661398 RepID=A0A482VXV7_ASBVE|nr:NDK domain containing protein [Asbolus verrucosus]
MSSSFGTEYTDKLCFLAEWFDFESAYQKRFLLNYYPCDSTIELYDRDLHRIFLKRSAYEGISTKNVFVGNTIRIYGRQIKITDYADCRTKNIIGSTRQHTFGLIKPSVIDKIGEIFNQIQDRHFEITKVRMCHLNQAECLELYDHLVGDAFLPFVVDHITSGPVVAVELVADNSIERWKENVGPTDPLDARKATPDCLRALYGFEKASNAFHAADNCEAALKKIKMFFPEPDEVRRPPQTTLQLKNSTCCVIKPHAILEGKLGYIISFITDSKFKVTAMQTFYLTSANASEFLEVYKGVVNDFHALLLSFLEGPCIALEISGKTEDTEDVHGEFRKFVGPGDSEIARQIRPNSLRAKFGIDKYKNAVHCTDLKEDTVLELEYFFKILS